ncbi:Serpentine Receptor, class H [Caenorhabditis elegans]|uniref:Serpentine Receptor, class H n=1 Tax=Caenorhabditis elegans TaxID=6239 RepID=Q94302_CAEEL|nr:Serpentine Receptor, class H [Caenorhabditis elegans]CCD70901.1 Serpentine Receptor, class H [Caenorhabditis elegans]|eukprot:NP_504010.1 Serpentine Receptor, class H [Caenorhabditis elegans]
MPHDFCTSTFYLYTADFQRLFLHYFGFVAIPVHVYGAYCIIFHTPSSMKSVKLSLLNFHFLSCFFDLGLSFLTTPYILFPALAGYPLGVLKDFGVRNEHQLYFMLVVGAYMLVTIILVFENRLLILIPTSKCWRVFRTPWFITHFIVATVFFFPAYQMIPDQQLAKNFVISIAPCIPLYVNADLVFVMLLETRFFLRAAGVLILAGFMEIWIFAYVTDRLLGQQINRTMSKRTVELHKKFQKAFLTQLTIPILILILPIIYIGVSCLVFYHNQAINNITVIIVSSHGFFSTIVMIYIHAPYREFTLRWLTVLTHVRLENQSSVVPSNNIT